MAAAEAGKLRSAGVIVAAFWKQRHWPRFHAPHPPSGKLWSIAEKSRSQIGPQKGPDSRVIWFYGPIVQKKKQEKRGLMGKRLAMAPAKAGLSAPAPIC